MSSSSSSTSRIRLYTPVPAPISFSDDPRLFYHWLYSSVLLLAFDPLSSFAAVSYTHLDVYKRQQYCTPLFLIWRWAVKLESANRNNFYIVVCNIDHSNYHCFKKFKWIFKYFTLCLTATLLQFRVANMQCDWLVSCTHRKCVFSFFHYTFTTCKTS